MHITGRPITSKPSCTSKYYNIAKKIRNRYTEIKDSQTDDQYPYSKSPTLSDAYICSKETQRAAIKILGCREKKRKRGYRQPKYGQFDDAEEDYEDIIVLRKVNTYIEEPLSEGVAATTTEIDITPTSHSFDSKTKVKKVRRKRRAILKKIENERNLRNSRSTQTLSSEDHSKLINEQYAQSQSQYYQNKLKSSSDVSCEEDIKHVDVMPTRLKLCKALLDNMLHCNKKLEKHDKPTSENEVKIDCTQSTKGVDNQQLNEETKNSTMSNSINSRAKNIIHCSNPEKDHPKNQKALIAVLKKDSMCSAKNYRRLNTDIKLKSQPKFIGRPKNTDLFDITNENDVFHILYKTKQHHNFKNFLKGKFLQPSVPSCATKTTSTEVLDSPVNINLNNEAVTDLITSINKLSSILEAFLSK